MNFPNEALMDRTSCLKWIEAYLHPDGQSCPHCGAEPEERRWFRKTARSQLDVYRCLKCQGIYNLYSGTMLAGRAFTPVHVVAFIQGVQRGQSTTQLARDLCISRTTATTMRKNIQSILQEKVSML